MNWVALGGRPGRMQRSAAATCVCQPRKVRPDRHLEVGRDRSGVDSHEWYGVQACAIGRTVYEA